MQIRLTYFSKAVRDMSLQDIQDILGTARSNNADLEVCGMLCYESRWFLQTLEGDRDDVNELFLEIADDPRHDDVVISSYEYVDQRQFPDWHMGYAASSGAVNAMLLEFGMESFDPPAMTADQSVAFLSAMSQRQDRDAA
ncbi:MAG: BLUF domain-containing protein [Pseudomonadota bacterium]